MWFLYNTLPGRLCLNVMLHTGVLKLAAQYLESPASRWLIKRYIRKHDLDMSSYGNVKYPSYAAFFSRKRKNHLPNYHEHVMVSPCDGLLSICEIRRGSHFNVKGIPYRMCDLIPDAPESELFENGLCMIFRLQAKDYHHFCFIDDCYDHEAVLIPGELHSVQPIVLEKVPVFRRNKRYYHLLNTDHFGPVMQIEVGAVLVGDVRRRRSSGRGQRGREAGHFGLCGSTIMLFLTEDCKKKLTLEPGILKTLEHEEEVPVEYGKAIGRLRE